MPIRKATTGKKTGSKRSAKIAPGGDGPEDFDSDPPIIVSGGGSIDVDVPPKFKEKSQGPAGKKFKHELGDLDSVVIDDTVTIKLKPTSKLVINYK